jgi:hypothetical protein
VCIKREINLRRRRKKKGWSFGFDKVTWGIYKKVNGEDEPVM